MGAYGSPELGKFTEKKKIKKSNPILIIIDAIVLFIGALLIESLTLVEYENVFPIVLLITFGLIIGLTVGFFKKIRNKTSNRVLLLILSAIIFLTLIVAAIVG